MAHFFVVKNFLCGATYPNEAWYSNELASLDTLWSLSDFGTPG